MVKLKHLNFKATHVTAITLHVISISDNIITIAKQIIHIIIINLNSVDIFGTSITHTGSDYIVRFQISKYLHPHLLGLVEILEKMTEFCLICIWK